MISHSISDAQLAANRANAQLSTGPKIPEGKGWFCFLAIRYSRAAAHGFEFSTAEIERYIAGQSATWIAHVTSVADRNPALQRTNSRSEAA